MNNHKLLKVAGVLLLSAVMLFSASAVTANTDETQVKITAKNGAATFDTFSEGFEGGAIPAGWLNVDYDGDTYIWQNVSTPEWPSHSGLQSAMSESYINSPGPGAITPDNWLITPALTASATSVLTYWVAGQDPDWAAEHIEVWISTTGTTVPTAFTDQVDEYTCDSDVFVMNTVNLASYTGDTIYIAFRHCEVTDQYQIKIDDITVTDVTQPEDINPPSTNCTLAGTLVGGIYTSDVTVTLTATDDSSGVNHTYYILDAGALTTYTAPFIVSANGAHTVLYYSVDKAGNIEENQTKAFTIQHAAPITITIKGGFGVSATIKNTGTTALTNLSWSITLDGKMVFLGKTKTGTNLSLAAGEQKIIKDPLVLGFGATNIDVTVGTAHNNATAKVLLFFVIGVA